jgi:hypothetical protein
MTGTNGRYVLTADVFKAETSREFVLVRILGKDRQDAARETSEEVLECAAESLMRSRAELDAEIAQNRECGDEKSRSRVGYKWRVRSSISDLARSPRGNIPCANSCVSKIQRRIKAAVEMRAREECSGPRPGAITRRAGWLVNAALVLGPIGYYAVAPNEGPQVVDGLPVEALKSVTCTEGISDTHSLSISGMGVHKGTYISGTHIKQGHSGQGTWIHSPVKEKTSFHPVQCRP